MDRIERLLQTLLDEHKALRGITVSGSCSGPRTVPTSCDALRQQIVDGHLELLEALEVAVEKLTPPGCTCGAHETVIPLLESALARIKG